MRASFYYVSGLGIALAGLVACSGPSMPNRSDGRAFFAQNCTSCHGQTGKGDGELADGVNGTIADLTLLSHQNGGDFPATRALAYIWGDPEQGHLSRVMPEFGPVMSDDLVPVELDGVLTPTPRALAGLLSYLESIQK